MTTHTVIAQSQAFQDVLQTARTVAKYNSNVLITGESGTGKEVVARNLHRWSPRCQGPFLAINCAAIPESLLESELFGYSKGAFTGAQVAKVGLLEEASGGTVFLDEIGDMPWGLQSKLLRVLQERKVRPLGENQDREIDVRIVAATHQNLKKHVQERIFREDLFFRLNVIPIEIPALRRRVEDIVPLAKFFLEKFANANAKPMLQLTECATEALLQHDWPGNVRELENAIERVVVLSHQQLVTAQDFEFLSEGRDADNSQDYFNFENLSEQPGKIIPIEIMNQKYIEYALALNKGAKNKTARELGIDRKTLYRKLHL